MTRFDRKPVNVFGVERSVEIRWPARSTIPEAKSSLKESQSPTILLAQQLSYVFDHYNKYLFGDRLPRCVITAEHSRGMAGYFGADRYVTTDGSSIHGIGLNPDYFHILGRVGVFAVVVHEQSHLYQRIFGTPPSRAYHDLAFADIMSRVGLQTSSTGAPGGKRTGVRMSHYPIPGGRFARVTDALIAEGADVFLRDNWAVQRSTQANKEISRAPEESDRATFSCIGCAFCKQPMRSS